MSQNLARGIFEYWSRFLQRNYRLIIIRSYDFEDTYDGLGDELDEGDDEFNDETFGGGSAGKHLPLRSF